jgi:hypothetical protein
MAARLAGAVSDAVAATTKGYPRSGDETAIHSGWKFVFSDLAPYGFRRRELLSGREMAEPLDRVDGAGQLRGFMGPNLRRVRRKDG